jgi:DNA-nicking Smr family endonuclease
MSRRRRIVTEEEVDHFREAIGEKPERKPAPTPPVIVPKTKTTVPAVRRIDTKGVDGNTAERLRRGQLEPDAKLDLHGLTEARAHHALIAFIRSARARGLKLVLIVTGKGLASPAADAPFDLELDRRSRGILKTMTPRWLKEPDLAPLVADVRHAHRRHGGEGALYVYLRRGPR